MRQAPRLQALCSASAHVRQRLHARGSNFHAIDITQTQHHIAVLRHTALPLIAFARPRTSRDITTTFVDHPDLAAAITNLTDAQVLTVEQLRTPLPQADLSALDPHKHDQINYWKPNTIGQLLFNYWD